MVILSGLWETVGIEKGQNFQRIAVAQAKASAAAAKKAKGATMPKRTFRIVRTHYPLTAICESCQQNFISRAEDGIVAEKEIRTAFDAHKCKREDASQAAARIVREATEDK